MAMKVNAPRRVLHFLESGGLYGAENVVLNISREMMKGDDYVPVIGCIVQCLDESVALVDKAQDYGIEAHRIVVNNTIFPLEIFRFLFFLRKFDIDLIHSHGYKASIIGFVAHLIMRKPVLPTCHLWFWGKDSPLKFRLMTMVEIFLYRYFKAITVVSQPIKQILVDRAVPAERIHIIKNGINLDDFSQISDADRVSLRTELGVGNNTKLIISLGRLTEQKAHADLILTAKVLKSESVNFAVLIVGDGELRNDLSLMIRELGLDAEVRLLGFRDDTSTLIQVSDVFILPSLDEGLPMALLEAMACRIPVIATPVGDVPEVLGFGENGMLVNSHDVVGFANAIKKVICLGYDIDCVDRGYNEVENKYSSEAMFNNYKTHYEDLL